MTQASAAHGTPKILGEVLGVQGNPAASKDALLAACKGDFSQATVFVLTDWQGRRDNARYALLVLNAGTVLLTHDAFGPRHGAAGILALQDVVRALEDLGAREFRECVLAPHDFSQILDYPDAAMLQRVFAVANYVNAGVYGGRNL